MRLRHHSRNQGFTLLEIMISLFLLSIILSAVYATWISILKGQKVGEDAAAAAQRTRMTMRALKDSLLCACLFNQNAQYYTFEAASEGDYASLSFAARLPKAFPRGGKFGDLEMRRLTYTVENGPDGKRRLVLRQSPILMDPDKDETQFPLVLAKDVSKFIIECIDPQTGDWIPNWTITNQLPREVRITIGLGKLDQFSSEVQEAMVGIVALPAQAVRVEWQMPGAQGGGLPPPGLPGGQGYPPGVAPPPGYVGGQGQSQGYNPPPGYVGGQNPTVNPGLGGAGLRPVPIKH